MASKRSNKSAATAEFHRASFPFYWIARVNATYAKEMEQVLKAIDCDIPTWRVLAILHEQGSSSVSEISVHAISKLSTITRIILRMKAEDLVATSVSEDDGRVTVVSMSPRGEQTLLKIHEATHGLFERSFAHLSKPQLRALNESLEIILNNLNETTVEAKGRRK